jgi:FAD/FMN-containing dehydrogenase
MTMREWVNWSGSLKFTPTEIVRPESESALIDAVKNAYRHKRKLRVSGAGHSSSSLVETDQTLISLENFKGIVRHDAKEGIATLKTGMTVHEVNEALKEKGLALFNTGDVDVQMLTGAISTGTHGTGKKLPNLSSVLEGVRLIDYKGDVAEYTQREHPDLMKAIRVSLGTLGIFTEITVKVLPLFRLKRLEICTYAHDCVRYFDELSSENRNVDFYWYPRSDETKIRILNEPGKGSKKFPFKFNCKDEEEGWVGDILPRKRVLKFDEMEYSFPADAAMECFQAIRKRIKEKHRKIVAWRVLYRAIAADDNYLSPHTGRDSVTISLHHNAGLPYEEYFSDIEPVFIDFGGRPHWGKKHSLKGEQLRKLYPDWDRFHEIRKSFDPERIFVNAYLQQLFYD